MTALKNTEAAMSTTNRIAAITLEEGHIVQRSPEVEHERRVAIADLLEENHFAPLGEEKSPIFEGPYNLHLQILDNRLYFHISIHEKDDAEQKASVVLPISPFRRTVKDYFMICESYYDAIQRGNHQQVEAIDMGRRGVHNEGSELLVDLLEDKIRLDFETARRLFTLVCVLHLRG